jgi:hypothetical protein
VHLNGDYRDEQRRKCVGGLVDRRIDRRYRGDLWRDWDDRRKNFRRPSFNWRRNDGLVEWFQWKLDRLFGRCGSMRHKREYL